MSWGYFVDARLHLPATAWAELSKRKTDEFPTPVGWWGMKDAALERRFIDQFGDVSKSWRFGALVKYFAGTESLGTVTPDENGRVTVRIAMLLSKDMDTDVARGVAALFQAAKDRDGEGSVSLANDGTYVGEDGVIVTLAKGKLSRKAIKDAWAHTEQLARELYGEELYEFEDEPPSPQRKKTPTKKPAKKPAKKAPTKKAAAKR